MRLAANRAMSPNSVTGISLLLGFCAAAWFSGGTRADDLRGLITTGVWVVVRAAARQLAAVTPKRRRREPGESDWLVMPGFNWSAGDRPDRPEARGRNFGWFYAVCATAAECAIYGGIAAGAESAGWSATWPLAIAIVIVGSVAANTRACGPPALAADRLTALTFPPIGVLALLAALITASYTPRIALVAVLAAGVISLAGNLVGTASRMAAGRRATGSPGGRAAMSAAQDAVIACRDDGPIARRAGWLVRGNLMPVPAAVAGVVAIGLLALLGIKNLPGIVALTPVVVLLLAAPGSSHPHDGRWDWLAPALLCLAQYGYLAALGAAKAVSVTLVFAACSMTAVWYASLAAGRTAAAPRRAPATRKARVSQIMARRTEGIGWEGRVGVAGLAGMFGIATFGYLGLTVCLGALIGRKAVVDYLRQGEDQRQ